MQHHTGPRCFILVFVISAMVFVPMTSQAGTLLFEWVGQPGANKGDPCGTVEIFLDGLSQGFLSPAPTTTVGGQECQALLAGLYDVTGEGIEDITISDAASNNRARLVISQSGQLDKLSVAGLDITAEDDLADGAGIIAAHHEYSSTKDFEDQTGRNSFSGGAILAFGNFDADDRIVTVSAKIEFCALGGTCADTLQLFEKPALEGVIPVGSFSETFFPSPHDDSLGPPREPISDSPNEIFTGGAMVQLQAEIKLPKMDFGDLLTALNQTVLLGDTVTFPPFDAVACVSASDVGRINTDFPEPLICIQSTEDGDGDGVNDFQFVTGPEALSFASLNFQEVPTGTEVPPELENAVKAIQEHKKNSAPGLTE